MMMRYAKITTVLFLVAFALAGQAQRSPRNNIYGEAMGISIMGSIQYERIQPLFKNRLVLAGAHVGAGLIRERDSRGYSIPYGVNVCVGARQFYGEVGYSRLYLREKSPGFIHSGWRDPTTWRYSFWHVGVRYQPRHRGLFLRGFVFPFSTDHDDAGILLDYMGNTNDQDKLIARGINYVWWVGLDVGYAF